MTAGKLLKVLKELDPNDEISFGSFDIKGHVTSTPDPDVVIVENKYFSCSDIWDIERGEELH